MIMMMIIIKNNSSSNDSDNNKSTGSVSNFISPLSLKSSSVSPSYYLGILESGILHFISVFFFQLW
jgi:hypothetical protein